MLVGYPVGLWPGRTPATAWYMDSLYFWLFTYQTQNPSSEPHPFVGCKSGLVSSERSNVINWDGSWRSGHLSNLQTYVGNFHGMGSGAGPRAVTVTRPCSALGSSYSELGILLTLFQLLALVCSWILWLWVCLFMGSTYECGCCGLEGLKVQVLRGWYSAAGAIWGGCRSRCASLEEVDWGSGSWECMVRILPFSDLCFLVGPEVNKKLCSARCSAYVNDVKQPEAELLKP